MKPWPILQCINLCLAILVIAWEWPILSLRKTIICSNPAIWILNYLFIALTAASLYQGTDVALYYIIGTAIYAWALYEGEVSTRMAEPRILGLESDFSWTNIATKQEYV